jgi:hypothetical protein
VADDRPFRVVEAAVGVKLTVVARREHEKQLTGIQITSSGTSITGGGPVFDGTGRLVGVFPASHDGTAGGTVTPVSAVRRFLAAPHVTVEVPAVKPGARHDPVTVRVGVFTSEEPADDKSVQLVVRSNGRERTVDMKRAKGGYEAAVVPFEKGASPPPVRVEVTYPDGSVRGETADRPLRVGGKEHLLGRLAGVRFETPKAVRLADGTTTEGEVTGLEGLTVSVGGKPWPVDTAVARQLTVLPPTEPTDGFRLTAVVRRGGKEVGRASDLRFIEGSEPWGIAGLRLGRLVKPPTADAADTWAALAGSDGEHHFGGREYRYDARRVRVSGPPKDVDSAVTVELHTTHPKDQTTQAVSSFQPGLAMRLDPPKGQLLGERVYPTAVPLSRLGVVEGAAGVQLTVDKKLLEVTYGSVAVWELEVADGGKKVSRLALDAILYPDRQSDAPLYLSVRYNSKYK